MKKETTKKEKIINGVLIAAGIGLTTYIGYTAISNIKLTRELNRKEAELQEKIQELAKGIAEQRKELSLISGVL